MQNILLSIQLVVSLILIFLILIQTKGTGFGRVWGSPTSFTRRGLEKLVFRLTFIMSGIFILISIIELVY